MVMWIYRHSRMSNVAVATNSIAVDTGRLTDSWKHLHHLSPLEQQRWNSSLLRRKEIAHHL